MLDKLRRNKKEEEESHSGCEACGRAPKDFKMEEAMEKQMNELRKTKVKSMPCPYIQTCTFKMLPGDFEVLCNDQEKGTETELVHIRGRHLWELCKEFFDNKRNAEGKLPRDLLAQSKKK